jgi:TolB-like protein
VRDVGALAARLTDTGTSFVLPAERFDRPVLDVFALRAIHSLLCVT